MQESVEEVAQKYVLRRSRSEVSRYCPEVKIPDVKLQIIKLRFKYVRERDNYNQLLLDANLSGDFKDKSATMLATLNKTRAACGAVKGIPSTKVKPCNKNMLTACAW